MEQINYHIRPQKAVDRNLFCETLVRMKSAFSLDQYQYIGFGATDFDDFKLFHMKTGMQTMHSVEMDPSVFERQKFNRPYSCIQLHNELMSTFIDEEFDPNISSVIWLDFSDGNDKKSQFSDICNVTRKLKAGDILRITLNAQAGRIVSEERRHPNPFERFAIIKAQIGEYLPEVPEKQITKENYPQILLSAIRTATNSALESRFLIKPISCYRYADGQEMMTITAVILSREEKAIYDEKLDRALKDWEYATLDWNKIIRLSVPVLTLLERITLNQYLPLAVAEGALAELCSKTGLTREVYEDYQKIYKYYPNYQIIEII